MTAKELNNSEIMALIIANPDRMQQVFNKLLYIYEHWCYLINDMETIYKNAFLNFLPQIQQYLKKYNPKLDFEKQTITIEFDFITPPQSFDLIPEIIYKSSYEVLFHPSSEVNVHFNNQKISFCFSYLDFVTVNDEKLKKTLSDNLKKNLFQETWGVEFIKKLLTLDDDEFNHEFHWKISNLEFEVIELQEVFTGLEFFTPCDITEFLEIDYSFLNTIQKFEEAIQKNNTENKQN